MKNHVVTAVGWNRMNVTSQCTGPILLGTSKGLIFEIKLNAESDKLFQYGIESYCKDVSLKSSKYGCVYFECQYYQFSGV